METKCAMQLNKVYLNTQHPLAAGIVGTIAEGLTAVVASRPISGEQAWEGDWIKGRHYAVGSLEEFGKHWKDYDASEIVVISNAEVLERVRAEASTRAYGDRLDGYIEKHGDRGVAELASNWLNLPYWVEGDRNV